MITGGTILFKWKLPYVQCEVNKYGYNHPNRNMDINMEKNMNNQRIEVS